MADGIAAGEGLAQAAALQRKVMAATGIAAVGSAVAIIVTWTLGGAFAKLGLPFRENMQSAFNTVFMTVSAFMFGSYTSPDIGEAAALDEAGNPITAFG